MKKVFVVVILFLTVIFIVACNSTSNNCASDLCKDKKYFIGSQGVRVEVDPGSPPSRIYYYSKDTAGNNFQIGVTVKDVGASATKGGIYISGYDPAMINIEGINVERYTGSRWSNCVVDFDLTGESLGLFQGWSGYYGCADQSFRFDDQANWEININKVGELLGLDSDFLQALNVNFGEEAGKARFTLGWSDASSQYNLDMLNLGAGMLFSISSLNFNSNNGREYLLRGNNYNFPGGEQDYLVFDGSITNWPKNLEESPQTFMITNCYAYTTYASPNVCIDPQPFAPGRKACTPKPITWSGSQGAPVAISRVEQENTPYSVVFTISVSNVGNGDVYDLGKVMKCSPYSNDKLMARDFNVVMVGDVRIGRQLLHCQPKDKIIRLVNGKGQITCTYDLEYATARTGYMTPLIVELWYGYSETQTKYVTFKRAG
jgi:hypothetical protein